MSNERVIFLVRGLPGSGRTTAIERVREGIPGLVFVDADPPGTGDEFSDKRAHHDSIVRAAEDIRGLVQHGVEAIAVETCAPHARDVERLLAPGRKAGYSIEELDPAAPNPTDVIECFERSSRQPNPEFLAELIQRWEPVDLRPAPRFDVSAHNRKEAFRMFVKSLGAATHEDAQRGIEDVFTRFPAEAAAMQLEAGPRWGRFPSERAASFPLADVSPYWADLRASALEGARRLGTVQLPSPSLSPAGIGHSSR